MIEKQQHRYNEYYSILSCKSKIVNIGKNISLNPEPISVLWTRQRAPRATEIVVWTTELLQPCHQIYNMIWLLYKYRHSTKITEHINIMFKQMRVLYKCQLNYSAHIDYIISQGRIRLDLDIPLRGIFTWSCSYPQWLAICPY